MPGIITLRIPRPVAWSLAIGTSPATAADPGYQIKNILATIGNPIRPWRFIEQSSDHILIAGWNTGHPPDAVNIARLGIECERTTRDFVTGDTIVMEAEFQPTWQTKTLTRDPQDPTIILDKRTHLHDVYGREGQGTSRPKAYLKWFLDKIARHETGLSSITPVSPVSSETDRVIRKLAGKTCRLVTTPRASLRFTARIEDSRTATAFITNGIGRGKAFGYASILPVDFIDSFKAPEKINDAA